MSVLSASYFHDEAAAYAELEATLWPDGPVARAAAAWIGSRRSRAADRPVSLRPVQAPVHRHGRHGVRRSSHVPLHQWLQAVYLMCSSKKGVSSHQLMRVRWMSRTRRHGS